MKLLAPPASQKSYVEEGEMGKQEIEDWLLSVGISSPVTKESAGALYHQQLARQVHVLARNRLWSHHAGYVVVD